MCDGRKEETHESIKKQNNIYRKRKINNGYIRFNQRISEVDEMRNFVPQEDDEIIETDATYVIPGFIDVHSHGGYGKDSMDASADEIDWMVRQMAAKEGITTYFCTTMTQTYDNIEKAMVQIKEAAEKIRSSRESTWKDRLFQSTIKGHRMLLILRNQMRKHLLTGMS